MLWLGLSRIRLIEGNLFDWFHSFLSCFILRFVKINTLNRFCYCLVRSLLSFILLNTSSGLFNEWGFFLVSDILLIWNFCIISYSLFCWQTLFTLIFSYVILLNLDSLSLRLRLVSGLFIQRLCLIVQLLFLCVIMRCLIRDKLLEGNLNQTKTQ